MAARRMNGTVLQNDVSRKAFTVISTSRDICVAREDRRVNQIHVLEHEKFRRLLFLQARFG